MSVSPDRRPRRTARPNRADPSRRRCWPRPRFLHSQGSSA